LIDILEFEKRLRIFERVENKEKPHTFSNFWLYKLKIEDENNHILDKENIERTLSKLGNILKKWDWNRPYSFEASFKRLSQSLTRISESYNRIRHFSLKDFDKIPEKELRIIWKELGSIKEPQDNLNNNQGQLINIPLPVLEAIGLVGLTNMVKKIFEPDKTSLINLLTISFILLAGLNYAFRFAFEMAQLA